MLHIDSEWPPGRSRQLVLLTFVLALPAAAVVADRSDPRARAFIFGRPNLSDVLGGRARSAGMPRRERFEMLQHQVLPAEDDSALCIGIDFTPACPPRPAAAGQEGPPEDLDVGGGDLISPAIDLVATAQELGRLEELQREVLRRAPATPEATLNQLALRILIAMSGKDFERANALIEEFYRQVTRRSRFPSERPAEAVIVWTAIRHPQTRGAGRDLAYLLYEQARQGNGPRSERWHRQMYALKHSLDPDVERAGDDAVDEPAELRRWIPVSRRTAQTSAAGYPRSQWTTALGAARHVAGHDHDYLCYSAPLQGDFDIQADLTTFDYRDIHLVAGGLYAGPGYDRKSCLIGSFRKDFPSLTIDPPLTRRDSWLRARISVRDGVRTSYVNGRKVYETPHGGDPWVGVHSAWYASGTVRNLRITGDASIPDEIDLVADAKLPGWLPWLDETVGDSGSDWHIMSAASREPHEDVQRPVLVGRRRSELSGALLESHLRYHRPVVEDGVIRYEFFYRPGECDVHPAVGRVVFLLNPAGVTIHLTTDGRFDRVGRDPGNATIEPENRRGDGPLPLQSNDWNRMEVELLGETVHLSLNGQRIYERTLAPANDRTFGLFHYADQSEALVRRLVWRGDWPRDLPEPHEQELADDSLERKLAAGPPRTASFSHEFAEGIPRHLFHILGAAWEDHVEQLPGGVRLWQPGGSYERTGIAPQVRLAGDFDVEVEFAALKTQASPGGHANIHLLVELDDAVQSRCRVYRKHFMRDDGASEQLVQAALFQTRKGMTHYGFPASPPGESANGRLRISRRGRTVYYLCSDSSDSREWLVHSQEISAAATLEGGVRLVVETDREGETSVIWKRLRIRAEELTGLALEPMPTVAELDRQREALSEHLVFDFRNAIPSASYQVWGTAGRFERDADGLRIEMPGFERWMATGLTPRVGLEGDFDISLELDVLKLEQVEASHESTVYLETETAGRNGTSVQTKYSIDSSGRRDVEVQLRRREPNGEFRYLELNRTESDQIHELRLARRGDVAWFMFRPRPESRPLILSRLRLGSDPVLEGFCRALVHTGGADRTTVVRFRKLSIRADHLRGANGK
ncbi:MAG: DUF1583 domain-containing protein [Maioricimonas sp. JB049]